MRLTFRRATEDDLGRLIAIHEAAFPDARSETVRRRNFMNNPLGALDDLMVAEQGDTLVGHVFLFPLRVMFGAVAVAVGGIATLAVAPEARGRGVARALLRHAHETSLARGDAITMLYPFRHAFYARDGYAPVAPFVALEFSPRAVPSAWGAAGGGKIRPASGEDRAGIERLHRAQIERRCGGILRPVALWDRKFVGDRLEWFVLDEGQAVTGYVGLSRDQSERGAPVSMSIEDLAAENDQGRLRLLSFVSAQRDQVERVRMSVPVGDPLAIALADGGGILAVTPRSERPVGTLCAGPMVRMADVGRALGSRGYAADGDIELRLPDGPHHVSVKNRRAELGRQGEAPWIELEPTALASILYGSLLPSSAVSLGWVRGTPAAIERADALFRAPAFFSEDSF